MKKSIIKIRDLTKQEILNILDIAKQIKSDGFEKFRKSKHFVVGLVFFEESTRTRIGFEVATKKLGGDTFFLNETKNKKTMSIPESKGDTLMVLQDYCDILCLRDGTENSENIGKKLEVPIVNCGDNDEHPTQSLIDLMAIREHFGRLDNLKILMVGDLRNMRVAHSFLLAISKFSNIEITCVSPKKLRFMPKYTELAKSSGNKVNETEVLNLKNVDVIYVAGLPPHTPQGIFDSKIRKKYQINSENLITLDYKSIILCPLPRVDEIDSDVDKSNHAKYFLQSKNGMFVRAAIILTLLKK